MNFDLLLVDSKLFVVLIADCFVVVLSHIPVKDNHDMLLY